MSINIKSVENKSDLKKFVKAQWLFYKNDPNFVPPVIQDRMKLLNQQKNPFFKHSKIKLFLAERNGKFVGRIAAIVNGNHNVTHNDKVGFFGFFECENEQDTANKLFDVACDWLKEQGMTSARGPVNPSMNDEIGLLIRGYDSAPVILMTYNPEYYATLIENYGFSKVKDIFAYKLKHSDYMTDKMKRLHSVVRERYNITARSMNFKDKKSFARDVQILKNIYNEAWEPNWGFVKLTDEEFQFLADDLKQIAWEDLVIILESNSKPVGFALGLPDINQSLIYNKSGSLLGAAWHLLTKKSKINWFRIIVLGLLPEFQGKGIDAVLYYELGVRSKKHNIEYGEASWILEDNEMMNRGLTVTLKSECYKTYRIYEKGI